jgi:hypothetical protein
MEAGDALAEQGAADRQRPVRVFVSYAHDDEQHVEQVRSLWVFLRQAGVDARLDVTAAQTPRDWTLWMGGQLRACDVVLVVGSPAYRRRAEGRAGADEGRGVQWEAGLIRDLLYRDQLEHRRRVLGVLLPGATVEDLPDWLTPTTSTHYRVHDFSVVGLEDLYRFLTDQPGEVEPELGPVLRLDARDTGRSTAAATGVRGGADPRDGASPPHGHQADGLHTSASASAPTASRTAPRVSTPAEALALALMVDALLAIPEFASAAFRDEVLSLLRREIAGSLARSARARPEAVSLVMTCQRFPGGLGELREAVRLVGGNSPEVLAFSSMIDDPV